jgi:hypothetical protein
MRVPRPAGDTAWKCAGFRAPMAAIRSAKAGFVDEHTPMYTGQKGEPQLALRPEYRRQQERAN